MFLKSITDLAALKQNNAAKRQTQSTFVKAGAKANIPTHSNGESAYKYFSEKITHDSLYLLDEPENSLSPKRQQELALFLEEAVRFYNCQIIMATHSPFLLQMREARIYDLDTQPVTTQHWSKLPHVQAYYQFFKQHDSVLSQASKDN